MARKYTGESWPNLPWYSRKFIDESMEEMQHREKGKEVVIWLRVGYSS
jgi:hypothetical protein